MKNLVAPKSNQSDRCSAEIVCLRFHPSPHYPCWLFTKPTKRPCWHSPANVSGSAGQLRHVQQVLYTIGAPQESKCHRRMEATT